METGRRGDGGDSVLQRKLLLTLDRRISNAGRRFQILRSQIAHRPPPVRKGNKETMKRHSALDPVLWSLAAGP
jgi:hypothetical protein